METIQIGIKDTNTYYDFRETCFGICVVDQKIYLTKKNNELSLIGGGLEPGETYNHCLVREFLEESGCKIKQVTQLFTIDCFWVTRNKTNMESLTHIFKVEIEDDFIKPLEEESELVILDVKEALAELKLPYQKKALEIFLKDIGDLT